MFIFPRQKTFDIGGVRVGGQADVPCVLIGTIFYENEGIFVSYRNGKFDRKKAESLINEQEELSDRFGNPSMVDIYADSKEKIVKYIDFVSDATDAPFLIDSNDPGVRVRGISYAEEMGLVDRTVYNSINASVTKGEIEKLKLSSINNAIALAFNPLDNSTNGRIKVLEDGGHVIDRGLIDIAKSCGIENILIDTGVTPLGDGAGSALRAVIISKARFGLPTGNGIHNAISACKWLTGVNAKETDFASNALLRLLGADFVFYGPIENSEGVFRGVSFVERLITEMLDDVGVAE